MCPRSGLVAAFCLVSTLTIPVSPCAAAEATIRDRFDQALQTFTGDPLAKADIDMRHLLDLWTQDGGRTLAGLSVADARTVPNLAQALAASGRAPVDGSAVAARELRVAGAAGPLRARLYTPPGGSAGALRPIILYFGGGGFVRGGLDEAEGVARALVAASGSLLLSVEYRRAPENKFPAAAEDATAAYRWLVDNASGLGGDPVRLVVAGEEAGANLAVNAAIAARAGKLPPPTRLLLLTPMLGTDTGTQSYEENARARPLGKADVLWALDLTVRSDADRADPRLDLIGHGTLAGLPPTTIVTAQIDPLRSDGERFAARLQRAGIAAQTRDFPGVTHGFFGLDSALAGARDARAFVSGQLRPPEATARE